GHEVLTWWSIRPGVEKQYSLGAAIAGATGVSGGAAHTIPVLLLGKAIGGRRITEMEAATRIGDAELDGVTCFRVTGTLATTAITLWIDASTFLVRRIDSPQDFGDFRTETTTTYCPVVDAVV